MRYSRLLLQSGIMHILETYQQGKKEGHKPRTRGEICKPTNVWFQHKSDYGWAGKSYRSCASRGSCHHSDRENVKILHELHGLVRESINSKQNERPSTARRGQNRFLLHSELLRSNLPYSIMLNTALLQQPSTSDKQLNV